MGRAFYVMLSNLSDEPLQIPKEMTVASTVNVAELVLNTNVLPNDSVNKMQDTIISIKLYRKYESSDERVARRLEVESQDDENEKNDFWKLVTFNEEYVKF